MIQRPLRCLASITAFAAAFAVAFVAAAADPVVVTEVRIYQLHEGAIRINGEAVELHDAADGQWMGVTNGTIEVGEGRTSLVAPEMVKQCVSAPRVASTPGQKAEIQVGRDVPGEHMVAEADGRFRLEQRDPQFEGLRIALVAKPSSDGGTLFERFEVRMSQCVGREPVTGTTLPVGRPIMRTQETSRSFLVRPGQQALFAMPALDGSGDSVLVVVSSNVASEGLGGSPTPPAAAK